MILKYLPTITNEDKQLKKLASNKPYYSLQQKNLKTES